VDIQAYISSGKLELFLLGELGEREREEVVRMAKKYPEIQKELDQLQDAFLEIDQKSGIAPPDSVKNKIFKTLEAEFVKEEKPPVREVSPAKVLPIQPWKTYFAAACVAAVLATFAAIYYANQYFDMDQKFTALVQEQSVLAEELNQFKVNFEQKDAQLETLLAGNFEKVSMKGDGFEIEKDALVDVWWDQSASSVFVSVNNLSSLEDQYDYQLWAIGDQGPVGIGLVNADQKFSLQQMEAVASAGTFAITIEPKGGSQSPTLEKLVVIGNVG
jgi:anti-sigma-K factor RskA